MGKYDDIINLPHHVSENHPQMSMQARAAQFSPFAALSGHGDAIRETERLTDAQRDLDEDVVAGINRTLQEIQSQDHPEVSIVYFQPDSRKDGGAYVSARGRVKRIDQVSGTLVLTNGNEIPIGMILDINFC